MKKEARAGQEGSYTNVGLYKDCLVDRSLIEGVRCTVKIDNYQGTCCGGVFDVVVALFVFIIVDVVTVVTIAVVVVDDVFYYF